MCFIPAHEAEECANITALYKLLRLVYAIAFFRTLFHFDFQRIAVQLISLMKGLMNNSGISSSANTDYHGALNE